MDDGDRALNGLAFIVTGSAAGIGLATVNRLLAQGACVLGVDKCAMPAADLPADAEKQFYSLLADVTDAEAPDAIVGQAMARFGRLDGLTNNAGAYPRGGVTDTSPEIYDRVMRLNLRAPFFLAQAVIGQALKTGKTLFAREYRIDQCPLRSPRTLRLRHGKRRADDDDPQSGQQPCGHGHPGQPAERRLDRYRRGGRAPAFDRWRRRLARAHFPA